MKKIFSKIPRTRDRVLVESLEINGIKDKDNTKNKLNKIFNKVIEVKKEDDLLCANMIMMNEGIVGSHNLSNKSDIKETNKTLFFNHPSTGGGGAHKCCSNILQQNNEIEVEEWIEFSKEYKFDMNYSSEFVSSVKSEIERLRQYTIF